jgi:hypothetical protein
VAESNALQIHMTTAQANDYLKLVYRNMIIDGKMPFADAPSTVNESSVIRTLEMIYQELAAAAILLVKYMRRKLRHVITGAAS